MENTSAIVDGPNFQVFTEAEVGQAGELRRGCGAVVPPGAACENQGEQVSLCSLPNVVLGVEQQILELQIPMNNATPSKDS